MEETCCPKCKEYPPEFEGIHYKGNNGKNYPKSINEQEGFNGWSNFHNWTEIHYYNECNIEFNFENGAY